MYVYVFLVQLLVQPFFLSQNESNLTIHLPMQTLYTCNTLYCGHLHFTLVLTINLRVTALKLFSCFWLVN